LAGAYYPATIKNLSLVAMDLHFDGSRPDVKPGDNCLIYLDGTKKNPYEISCQVIRVENSSIVVGINTMPPE
jgi:hypothetical protein